MEAQVTLVEYGDYECPHCGRAFPIVEEIRQQWWSDRSGTLDPQGEILEDQ